MSARVIIIVAKQEVPACIEDPMQPLEDMWNHAGDDINSLTISLILETAKGAQAYSSFVQDYELDRFVKQLPIQLSVYWGPLANKGFNVNLETWYTTTDINIQISGRYSFGNPNGTRFDQTRVTARLGQTEFYGDVFSGQVGGVIKGESELLSPYATARTKAEIAALRVPPINYQIAGSCRSDIAGRIPPFDNLIVNVEPGITIKHTIHGGPTAAAGGAALIAAAAAFPEITLPILGGGLRPVLGY